MRSVNKRFEIHWVILFIAVLEISAWSFGSLEATSAKQFYSRERANLQVCVNKLLPQLYLLFLAFVWQLYLAASAVATEPERPEPKSCKNSNKKNRFPAPAVFQDFLVFLFSLQEEPASALLSIHFAA